LSREKKVRKIRTLGINEKWKDFLFSKRRFSKERAKFIIEINVLNF